MQNFENVPAELREAIEAIAVETNDEISDVIAQAALTGILLGGNPVEVVTAVAINVIRNMANVMGVATGVPIPPDAFLHIAYVALNGNAQDQMELVAGMRSAA